jgi:hypothetical protein
MSTGWLWVLIGCRWIGALGKVQYLSAGRACSLSSTFSRLETRSEDRRVFYGLSLELCGWNILDAKAREVSTSTWCLWPPMGDVEI